MRCLGAMKPHGNGKFGSQSDDLARPDRKARLLLGLWRGNDEESGVVGCRMPKIADTHRLPGMAQDAFEPFSQQLVKGIVASGQVQDDQIGGNLGCRACDSHRWIARDGGLDLHLHLCCRRLRHHALHRPAGRSHFGFGLIGVRYHIHDNHRVTGTAILDQDRELQCLLGARDIRNRHQDLLHPQFAGD